MHEPVVVFSGGGTGGHLYPALALADAVQELRPEIRPFFVGAERGIESRILPERGLAHLLLPVVGLSRGGGVANVRAVPRLGLSLLDVAQRFQALRPEAVVVTGGYASGPAGIAAGAMGIPLVVQEQNSYPGRTTRLLSRWARQIHVAFPEALALLPTRGRQRARVSGNPVRPPLTLPAAEARQAFGLDPEGLVLLVTGGSQGSLAVNRAMSQAVEAVVGGTLPRPAGLHVLWVTGPSHFDGVDATLAGLGRPEWIRAIPYAEDMPRAMASANLAVSRAGAMTTAELLNQGLPAILVPLPTAAADHQRHNALSLEEAGAALLAPESGLDGESLWGHVRRLCADDELRRQMRRAALERARPEAAATIAQDIVGLLPDRGKA